MNATRLLLLVLGVFVVARVLNKDSQGQTLVGRLTGGQPSNSSITLASSGAATSANGAVYDTAAGTGRTGMGAAQLKGISGAAADTHSVKFVDNVLQSLHAPDTSANVRSLMAWIGVEGNLPGVDQFNPLDTTLPAPGAVSTNSAGVKSYRSWGQGVLATAETLAGGGYSAIVNALRSGAGLSSSNPAVSQELRTWSGGGYSGI